MNTEQENIDVKRINKELVEALDSLTACAKLALDEITDQDTGWYYQLQGAIQKGDKVLTKAKGGQAC